MKSTEEYISDYLEKYTTLLKKGELWRLRVTLNEFIKEIERIREYGIEQRKSNYLNEYHIQSNQNGKIEVLLMNKVTWDEAKAQSDMLDKATKLEFAAEAPKVQERLEKIQTPLKFNDVVNIYRWLSRKQITLEMLSKDILNEFKETRQYRTIVHRLNKE